MKSNPKFNPPVKFEIEKEAISFHAFNVAPTPFTHDETCFEFSYEKKLTSEEIDSGWLELAYTGFCEMALDRRTKSLKLVDDYGNI